MYPTLSLPCAESLSCVSLTPRFEYLIQIYLDASIIKRKKMSFSSLPVFTVNHRDLIKKPLNPHILAISRKEMDTLLDSSEPPKLRNEVLSQTRYLTCFALPRSWALTNCFLPWDIKALPLRIEPCPDKSKNLFNLCSGFLLWWWWFLICIGAVGSRLLALNDFFLEA